MLVCTRYHEFFGFQLFEKNQNTIQDMETLKTAFFLFSETEIFF